MKSVKGWISVCGPLGTCSGVWRWLEEVVNARKWVVSTDNT